MQNLIFNIITPVSHDPSEIRDALIAIFMTDSDLWFFLEVWRFSF